jgi:RNase P subunit RPR2
MEGLTGDEEILPYRDQVDVVAGFAEQEKLEESETPVALLDDMNSGRGISMKPKACKSCRWILNLKELRARLSKQVGKVVFLYCDLDGA